MDPEKAYEIVIGSPIDHEELVSYVFMGGKEIAMLSQDKGKDNLEVQFSEYARNLPFETVITALQDAKRRLLR